MTNIAQTKTFPDRWIEHGIERRLLSLQWTEGLVTETWRIQRVSEAGSSHSATVASTGDTHPGACHSTTVANTGDAHPGAGQPVQSVRMVKKTRTYQAVYLAPDGSTWRLQHLEWIRGRDGAPGEVWEEWVKCPARRTVGSQPAPGHTAAASGPSQARTEQTTGHPRNATNPVPNEEEEPPAGHAHQSGHQRSTLPDANEEQLVCARNEHVAGHQNSASSVANEERTESAAHEPHEGDALRAEPETLDVDRDEQQCKRPRKQNL